MAAVVLLAVASIGTSSISERLVSGNWDEINDRKGAWEDAIAIAKRYPLVGPGFHTYAVAALLLALRSHTALRAGGQ